MEKLSPSANCLLVAFCLTNKIKATEIKDGWIVQKDWDFTAAPTKLEAVRKLCKQLNIFCEL